MHSFLIQCIIWAIYKMQKNNYNYSKNTFYITVYNSYNIFDTSEIILFFIIYIKKKKPKCIKGMLFWHTSTNGKNENACVIYTK